MKGSLAANLALALVLVGAPVFYAGFWAQLGDPYPRPSEAVLAAERLRAEIAFYLGIAALITSLWLSGYAFSAAPRRSLMALALCMVSIFGLWFA